MTEDDGARAGTAVRRPRRRGGRGAARVDGRGTTCPAATSLFAEGEPGDRLYVVVDGKVKLGAHLRRRPREPAGGPGPGRDVRRAVAVRPGPRTATATALTDARLIGLGHADLQPWLTGRPEVAERCCAALARRLRRTNEAMADLVFSDVPGRVAKALLDLAGKFGEPQPDGSVRVTHDLTQEELAQLVGASRETVNKALADFPPRLAAPGGARGRPPRPRAPDPPRPAVAPPAPSTAGRPQRCGSPVAAR